MFLSSAALRRRNTAQDISEANSEVTMRRTVVYRSTYTSPSLDRFNGQLKILHSYCVCMLSPTRSPCFSTKYSRLLLSLMEELCSKAENCLLLSLGHAKEVGFRSAAETLSGAGFRNTKYNERRKLYKSWCRELGPFSRLFLEPFVQSCAQARDTRVLGRLLFGDTAEEPKKGHGGYGHVQPLVQKEGLKLFLQCKKLNYDDELCGIDDSLQVTCLGEIRARWCSCSRYLRIRVVVAVATYMYNDIAGIPQALQKSGRSVKAIRACLNGKEGHLRGNLMGKRKDISARTVGLDEIGIPRSKSRLR
ncbi:DNA-directed RNA polymerase II core subunit rpo21 [Marasmius tenuissimus]|nr:DNA-directed RNA polymerase II core subunit rpo21 [Marasmius tenuissimus]